VCWCGFWVGVVVFLLFLCLVFWFFGFVVFGVFCVCCFVGWGLLVVGVALFPLSTFSLVPRGFFPCFLKVLVFFFGFFCLREFTNSPPRLLLPKSYASFFFSFSARTVELSFFVRYSLFFRILDLSHLSLVLDFSVSEA